MPKVEKLAEFDQTIIPWYGKSFYLFFPSSLRGTSPSDCFCFAFITTIK
jgi:hypothetical protein